ncbi:MAG TPA: methylenetetrahydrofolate reductase [NAD(P)H] [Ruminococcaceae bacterium]|nr:methylenetetrahydrofolate reductase [NAD(P)H] [Oscillospiraceae bacterium]
MYISHLYQKNATVLSFEVFPPKKDSDIESIDGVLKDFADLHPDFMSVTYGAGGSAQTVSRSKKLADKIENTFHIPALFHLTCIGADKNRLGELLLQLRQMKIQNILALRGDFPGDGSGTGDYTHACDLIRQIKEEGGFCVGAACYPEGHIDCESPELDREYLKRKQEAGADFFISQLFFENRYFFRFLNDARKNGITVPISAGIMPILSRNQIERMIFMCGASLPGSIVKLLHRYGDNPADLRKAGIEYAVCQAEDLIANGADGVHLYTMNHPDIARSAMWRFRREKTANHE